MVTPICLLKPRKLNPINWGEQDDTDFEALKKNLMRPPALGHPNYQLPFCLFVYEKKGNVLRALTQKHAERHRPVGYCSQQLNPMAQGSCLRAFPATALWLRPLKRYYLGIIMGFHSTTVVLHVMEALLNSHSPNTFQSVASPHMKSFCWLLLT